MEQKDKIIISTGHEPEEMLETPHFDAEETLLAARPVVPLTEEAVKASHNSMRAANAATPLARRIPILALVIIAAVSVGLAGGLAIGLYKGRQQQKMTPASAQPSSTATTVDTRLQKPAEQTGKTQPSTVQTVAEVDRKSEPVVVSQSESGQIVVPEEVPETTANPQISDMPKPEKQAAPDRKTPDERAAPLPATKRKKAQDVSAGDDDSDKKQKSARRRRAVEQDRDDDDGQRRIERAGQELNRIRDIFEGARP
jgi:hypothetical protein